MSCRALVPLVGIVRCAPALRFSPCKLQNKPKTMNLDISRARVAVAALDSVSRARLMAALQSDPSLQIAGEVGDEAALSSLVRSTSPDILFLDPVLANRINGAANGWSATRIILAAHSIDRECVVEALRLRARGIVPLAAPAQTIRNSARTVLADEYWLDTDTIAMLLAMMRQTLNGSPERFNRECVKLTERELSVVIKIAGGWSNKEIGHHLSISERTVKHHLTNIFTKLGVSSRLQLANFASTHGLIDGLNQLAPDVRDLTGRAERRQSLATSR